MSLGNVLIIGDSYSTFKGYIPEGNETYYTDDNPDIEVKKVEWTWWYPLLEETNSHLVLNDSWSGTTVCHTGYHGDCSEICSFIFRTERLIKNGFFEENKIDTVFIFGGTNDSWANSPIGDLQFENWSKEDLFSFGPAICYLVDRIKNLLPNAQIILVSNCGLKEEITAIIKDTSKHYGTKLVELHDIDKIYDHPTIKGMAEIKKQVLESFFFIFTRKKRISFRISST